MVKYVKKTAGTKQNKKIGELKSIDQTEDFTVLVNMLCP